MDDKTIIKSSVHKISYALVTQALILICSLVTNLIVPKYMGTEQYGYWQIYYFYLNYINLITFGYNDGIVLKYGGMDQKTLPAEKLRSGNLIMLGMSLLIGLFGAGAVSVLNLSPQIRYIWIMLFASLPFACIFNIILSIFLAINRQEVYNKINFWNRFSATAGYCILLFSGIIGYGPMVAVDFGIRAVIGVVCILIGIYFLKGKKSGWKLGLQEIKENCGNGLFITAGALLASFTPMAGRIVLQNHATITEYGIFSFALSVLSLIVTFTNAAGIVFFPILKNMKASQMLGYYKKIETVYNSLITLGVGLYIPAVLVIRYYLVDYSSVLDYVYLIFALCIPLGKMQMVITPYMKAFRMEKQYFVASLLGAGAVLGCTSLVYQWSHSVYAVAFVTLAVFVIWNILLECYLKKELDIKSAKNIMAELVLIFVFILIAGLGNLAVFAAVYAAAVIILGCRTVLLKQKKNREE